MKMYFSRTESLRETGWNTKGKSKKAKFRSLGIGFTTLQGSHLCMLTPRCTVVWQKHTGDKPQGLRKQRQQQQQKKTSFFTAADLKKTRCTGSSCHPVEQSASEIGSPGTDSHAGYKLCKWLADWRKRAGFWEIIYSVHLIKNCYR